MIKGEHLHKEISDITNASEQLAKAGKVFESYSLKALTLLLKLVLNIRQNQVNALQHEGVELIKPKAKSEEK